MSSIASIFAFFLFLFFLSYSWISRRVQKSDNRRKVPPEASSAWPLIGHLHLLGGSQPPHITLGNMADKYGPIFTIWLGVHRTLVVSNWEIVKECFTTNDKAFANRPKALALELLGYNYAMFGFSPYGPYWRQVRKMAMLEVLSNHRLEMLKHIREAEVNDSIKQIFELLGKKNKVFVEMERWFGYTTLNMVSRMVVGKRFGGATTKYENEGNDQCRKALREFFDLTGTFVVADALPYLRWLDMGGYDADTIIKATCLALILAATDTTTVTLIWALSLLLNNRETLKKAQQELDIQVGRERQVKESDVKNLEYLQAILKETMRLYPAAPLLVPHESLEDCTLAGYNIPSGTRLLVNVPKLHQDPSVWVDPTEFRPERFLTTHKDVDVKGQHFELIPFGSGRRMCPGISFALQVTQLTLATLLHAFEIATPSDEPVDMTEKVGLTNLKATSLEVNLTPRLAAQAYA
uniref:Cytochrome P450 n=1 Tax=Quercus lobata TaxID=97700 RepID=A0A7N2MRE3_QUELO